MIARPQDFAQQRTGLRQPLRWLPVLMYHRVVDRVEGADPYYSCISTADFDAHMSYLRCRGYRAIPLEDVPLAAGAGSPWRKAVAITFDDGYRDTYTHALPILKKHGLMATVMIVSDHIGGRSTWDPDVAAPLLSSDEILEMRKEGIQFGAHTATHPSLPDIDLERAHSELVGSKATLEQLLGEKIRTLAYPYGRCTPPICHIAERAGFVAAFGVEHGSFTLLNYSRIDAARCPGDTFLWRLKVAGIYDTIRNSRRLRRLRDFRRRMFG